jgi:hypothetical protein
MSIDISLITEADTWDRYVDQSPGTGPFHHHGALVTLADHSGATPHLLAGFKGQEPVGVFPVFELAVGPIATAFSPPPDLRVPYLGPAVLNMAKLKSRKADRRRRRFIEGCLDYIADTIAPRYTHVRTDRRYRDTRPFKYRDWQVTPNYTYAVALDAPPEDLLMRMSSDARRNVRNTDGDRYTIAEGGPDDAIRILDQVRARYAAQDIEYRIDEAFVRELIDRTPAGVVRPYACRVDGEFAGGILALEDEDTIYRRQGGVKTDVDLPVNDLLDWHLVTEGVERGLDWYDLVGAEDPRINEYKSKFAPELQTYYSLTDSGRVTGALAGAYDRLRNAGPFTK